MADGRSARVIKTGKGRADLTSRGGIRFLGVVGTSNDASSITLTSDVPVSTKTEAIMIVLLGWAWNVGPDSSTPGAQPDASILPTTSVQAIGGCWNSGAGCVDSWFDIGEITGIDTTGSGNISTEHYGTACPVTKPLPAGTVISWTWTNAPQHSRFIAVALARTKATSFDASITYRLPGDSATNDCNGGAITHSAFSIGAEDGIIFAMARTSNVTDDGSSGLLNFGHGNKTGTPGFPTAGDYTIIDGPASASGMWQSLSVPAPGIPFQQDMYISYKLTNPGSTTETVDWQWACPGDVVLSGTTFYLQWHDRIVYGFGVKFRDDMPCCPRGIILSDRFKAKTPMEIAAG